MPKLSIANANLHEQVNSLIALYHKDLAAHGVKVQVIMARARTDSDGNKLLPTLALHGYAVGGIAKTLNSENRLHRGYDCEIKLDADAWDAMTIEERNALLDHELTHFTIARNGEGDAKEDEEGRPLLKMRKHDQQFGWFDEIAQRHGKASGEVYQATKFFEERGNIYFAFVEHLGAASALKEIANTEPEQSEPQVAAEPSNVTKPTTKKPRGKAK